MQIETVTVTCQGHSRTEQQRWTEIFVFPSHSPVPCHKAILHLSLLPQSKNTSFLFAYLAAVLSTGNRVLLSEQGTSGSGGWSNRDTWELVSLLEAWHSCCALERPPDSYSTLRFRASWSQWRQGEFAARAPQITFLNISFMACGENLKESSQNRYFPGKGADLWSSQVVPE